MNRPPLLMAPGPVPMPPDVLSVLSEPMIHHRTPEFKKILEEVLLELKNCFQTQQSVMCLTSTGTGAMEAAVTNTLSQGEKVLVIESGKFGERWTQICKTYSLDVDTLAVPWGQAVSLEELQKKIKNNKYKAIFSQVCETSTATLHPIQEMAQLIKKWTPESLFIIDAISALGATPLNMDQWGIDVIIAGSQKAFMIPTGLSMIAFSQKTWAAYKTSQLPKYYFDLKKELTANQKGETAFSSSVSLIKALNIVLKKWHQMGFENQIKYCEKLAQVTQRALSVFSLKIYSSAPSPSVTAFVVPESLDGVKLRSHIESRYKVTLMGGQDHLKGKIIRIGHLGFIQKEDLLRSIEAIGLSLIDFGAPHVTDDKIKEALKIATKMFNEPSDDSNSR